MRKILICVVVVTLLAGLAQAAPTAEDVETIVETALGLGPVATYLELTKTGVGDSREGLSLDTADDTWGYPDSSDGVIWVNEDCLDEKQHTASDFLGTISGLTPNTRYGLYVVAAGRKLGSGIGTYDFTWGTSGDGSPINLVPSVYNAPGAVQIAEYVTGADISTSTAVPIGIFTSDANGDLATYLGKGTAFESGGSYRTQLDGLVVGKGIIISDLCVLNPVPCDGETRVQPDKILSWDPPDPCELVDPPAEYIVYFDPNESLVASGDASVCFGQQSQNQFDPFGVGDMELVTTYYWRIDVVDPNFGAPVTYAGKVWHFTTIAPKAGLISPENGASGVAQNAVLKWDPGCAETGIPL